MEPISMFGLSWTVSEIFLFFGSILAGIITTIVAEKWGAIVQFRYDKSPEKVVGIFGASKHGKTNLILYLRGKPFREHHNKTYGTKTYSKKGSSAQWKKMASCFTDVDGAEISWYEVNIKKYNPEGIIFVVDPSTDESISEAVTSFKALVSVYDSIFHGSNRKVSLRVLLVLLSKSDKWGEVNGIFDASRKQKKEQIIQSSLAESIKSLKEVLGDKFVVQIDSGSFKERVRNPYRTDLIQALQDFKSELHS